MTRHKYIDSLRGVAALLVVGGHAFCDYFFLVSTAIDLPFEWVKQTTSGLAGVTLFFAISGYVIPSSLQEIGYEGAQKFAIRRFFRLCPIFWLSILPRLALYLLGNQAYSLDALLLNFTMIPTAFNKPFAVGVYWTLVHELLFYLICALLHLAGWLRQSRKIAWLTLCFSLGYWVFKLGEHYELWRGESSFFQKTVLVFLPIMLWGALWRLWRNGEKPGLLQKAVLAFIPLECLILAPRMLYTDSAAAGNFFISFGSSLALGIALFIGGTTFLKIHSRILIWIGLISYSLYLSHIYVIRASVYVVQYLIENNLLSSISFAFFFLFILVCSLLISAAGYHWVELPSIALGRKLTAPKPKSNQIKTIY